MGVRVAVGVFIWERERALADGISVKGSTRDRSKKRTLLTFIPLPPPSLKDPNAPRFV